MRREIKEELYITMPELVLIGDWSYKDEVHRVFGCEIEEFIDNYDSYELLAITWLKYEEVDALNLAGELHTGFELAAIATMRELLSPC